MNDVRIFEYIDTGSILNRIRPTVKLWGMIAICISAAALPPVLLLFPALLIAILMINSGFIVIRQFASMWKIFIFFSAAAVIRVITGSTITDGILFIIRLILMAAAGVLFYSSTRLSMLRTGLYRLFSLVPVINSRYVSDLTVMSLAFLPIIFKTINEQHQARYSRGFRPQRNILRTIKFLSIPLLIDGFIKTDEMADAWYSRGYISPKK